MAKRSQIAVGQEWAYKKSRSHYIGYSGYEKVTIEAIEPHEQSKYRGEIFQRSTGNGVKVKYEVQWYGETESRSISKVVQLSQLFIPWAEYEVQRAEYEAAEKIRTAKAKVEKAKREKFQQEVFNPALSQLLKAIKPFAGEEYVSGWTRLEELPIEVIQAVTEAIKEKAVA